MDPFEKLRKVVFDELKKQTAQAEQKKTIPLGPFLEACLVNRGKSRAIFAQELKIERELADAILDGLLPSSEISDVFLAEIAHVVMYDANLLRIMLGRSTTTTFDSEEVR